MKLKDHRVILNAQKASYPAEAPFGPEGNALYQSVAELIKTAYPASDGNYLGALIKPGDKVVIKPNVVKASHERKEKEWEQVVTHGAVVRAVIDHVLAALKGEGEVIVAEAPQTDTPFNVAMERCGIKAVVVSVFPTHHSSDLSVLCQIVAIPDLSAIGSSWRQRRK